MTIEDSNNHRFHTIDRKIDGLRDLLGRLVIGDNTDYCLSWEQIREKRDLLLSQSDWTQSNDSPLTSSKKTEWIDYRLQLRNLPELFEEDTPADVVFPDKPEPTPLPSER